MMENHSYNPDNNEYFSDLKDNILSKARHAKQGIHQPKAMKLWRNYKIVIDF